MRVMDSCYVVPLEYFGFSENIFITPDWVSDGLVCIRRSALVNDADFYSNDIEWDVLLRRVVRESTNERVDRVAWRGVPSVWTLTGKFRTIGVVHHQVIVNEDDGESGVSVFYGQLLGLQAGDRVFGIPGRKDAPLWSKSDPSVANWCVMPVRY